MDNNRPVTRRKALISLAGTAIAGTTVAGTGTVSATSTGSEHPKEEIISYGWDNDPGRGVAYGPVVIIDPAEGGGHREVLYSNTEEYADYIFETHDSWRIFNTKQAVRRNLRWHFWRRRPVFDDDRAGIHLWEQGHPKIPNSNLDGEKEIENDPTWNDLGELKESWEEAVDI